MSQDLWKSFKAVHGSTTTIVGLCFTFITWKFAPDTDVPLYGVVLLFVISILIMNVLFDAYTKKTCEVSPKIITATKRNYRGEEYVFLITKSSPLFSTRAYVSIYHFGGGIEILVCFGIVEVVQTNGKMQIRIMKAANGQLEIMEKITQSDKMTLESLIIKPLITDDFFMED